MTSFSPSGEMMGQQEQEVKEWWGKQEERSDTVAARGANGGKPKKDALG